MTRRTRSTWHIQSEGDTLTVARRVPVRMDVAAQATFPACNRLALAQQIRQDLWRRLQRLRGFAPVVQVVREADGLRVTAGGQLAAAAPDHTSAYVAEMLNTPHLRQRWIANASKGQQAGAAGREVRDV
ncbi:hypothetical protein [Thalassobius sp. Cn5-15]|jgi:hypothetical protein|uniref:hypothetical protein n=1 Tax=Thalassobius sp. Cn5-15 TaxID=2917763 RepID=UPI001EF3A7E5|nr:hypothetical protein [Thalassobius sp. Cn5-15]MCG7493116.1 hypothetical protein [Thalassobius sp. Cn5-15]